MLQRHRFALPWLAAGLVFLGGGVARAEYFSPIDGSDVSAAVEQIATRLFTLQGYDAKRLSREMLSTVIRSASTSRVLATRDSTSCPIRLKVINGSTHDQWNVVVGVGQSRSKTVSATKQKLHIPFLPARSMTRVEVACLTSYTYNRYSDHTIYIDYDDLVQSSTLSASTVQAMVAARSDASFTGGSWSPHSGTWKTVADQAMELNTDPRRFRELARHMLSSTSGTTAVVARVRERGDAAEMAALVGMVSPKSATATTLLNEVLSSSKGRDQMAEAVKPLLKARCASPGAARDVYLKAVSGQLGEGALQMVALAACAPSGKEVTASLESRSPEQVALILSAFDESRFSVAAEQLATTAQGRKQLRAALVKTEEPGKLTRALELCEAATATAPEEMTALVVALAGSKLDVLGVAKAAAFTRLLAKVEPAQQTALVEGLIEVLVDGRAAIPQIAETIRREADKAPEVRRAALEKKVRADSHVLRADAVLAAASAGKLDLFNYLAFNHEKLGDCAAGLEPLRACELLIAEKYDEIAKQKLAPELLEVAAKELLHAVETNPGDGATSTSVWATIERFRGWGLDTGPIVQRTCELAGEEQDRSEFGGRYYGAVSTIDHEGKCASELSSRKTKHLLGEIALHTVQAALTPVPFVLLFLFARSRWRKLRPKILAIGTATDGAATGGPGVASDALGRVELRWGECFRGALTEARRQLDDTGDPAARAAALVMSKLPVDELATETQKACTGALESGQARSLLLKLDGGVVCVAVFPGRLDQPALLRRNNGFTDGWVAFESGLRELIKGEPDGARASLSMLSLLVFLRPDAREGVLVTAYRDSEHHLLPGVLLDARETQSAAEGSYNHLERVELKLK